MERGKGSSGLRTSHLVYAAVAAAVLLLVVFAMRGESGNRTPEGAAAVFIKAMVTRDRELMEKINHSGPFDYPTWMLMEDATKDNWARYDLAKFSYRHVGSGVVEVTFPDGSVRKMQTVEENGRWYFVGWK